MIGNTINPHEHHDASMDIEGATVHVCRLTLDELKKNLLISSPYYRFYFSLTPRPESLRGHYSNHWARCNSDRLGVFFIVPPNESLELEWDEDVEKKSSSHTAIVCHIEPKLIIKWLDTELSWNLWRLEKTLSVQNISLQTLIKMLARETAHQLPSSQRMVELLVEQLSIEASRYLAHEEDTHANGGLATWRLRRIEERVKTHGKAPTLGELAKLCNISVRQLSRGFRVSQGCPLGSYIEEVRFEYAKRLVLDGEHINVVARQMGYSSQSSFSQAFRRATGMTPTYYQNRG